MIKFYSVEQSDIEYKCFYLAFIRNVPFLYPTYLTYHSIRTATYLSKTPIRVSSHTRTQVLSHTIRSIKPRFEANPSNEYGTEERKVQRKQRFIRLTIESAFQIKILLPFKIISWWQAFAAQGRPQLRI